MRSLRTSIRKGVGSVSEKPVARSPIQPPAPVEVRDGWEVSVVRSSGALRLSDRTPLTKVLVRADVQGRVAASFDVPLGRARSDRHGTLTIGSGPDEWLLLAPPHSVDAVTSRLGASDDELVSVVDMTDGRALMRLSGADAHQVLAKICAIDLSDRVTPDGAAFRSSVANVATDVVRNDQHRPGSIERSYLMHCERSSGQYLFDAILDAGKEFGIQIDGFSLDHVFNPRAH